MKASDNANPPASAIRSEFIDAGRAIAALSVFFQHSIEEVSEGFRSFTTNYFSLGIFGVTLFFLISGYIIPPSIARAGLLRFWINRFFRLYPLYWVSIVLVLVFSALAGDAHHTFEIKDVAINVTMFQEYLRTPHLMALYWTLSMEMLFYILCCFAWWAVKPKYNYASTMTLACVGVALPVANVAFADHSLAWGRLLILLSAFFGKHIREEGSFLSRRTVWVTGLMVGAIFSCGTVRFGLLPAARSAGEPSFSAVCAIASYLAAYGVFGVLFAARHRAFAPSVIAVGTWCYSIYLLHPFVVRMLSTAGPPFFSISVALLACLCVSWASWIFFEKPIIGFGKILSGRLVRAQTKDQSAPAASCSPQA